MQGLDEFAADPDRRWEQYRSLGPALLGCVPWLDDPELLDRILTFPSSCVLITKPELKEQDRESFQEFKRKVEQGPGFPAEAFAELTGLDYRVDGRPPVIGPYSPRPQVVINYRARLASATSATGDHQAAIQEGTAILPDLGGRLTSVRVLDELRPVRKAAQALDEEFCERFDAAARMLAPISA
ncbi:hypothetical protein ACFHYQ_08185 [Sphaerimonospora cavernae]|uniref:Uncharacterized protein n=1 Tax=Sphaerimonospora cavernae TaxID=1740611 RepID=A0ABV6U1D0_9ACTN